MPDEEKQVSVLVSLSARAIGSVGFAMSVFAIWLDWVLPASKSLLPELDTRVASKTRRRSAPAELLPAPHRSRKRKTRRQRVHGRSKSLNVEHTKTNLQTTSQPLSPSTPVQACEQPRPEPPTESTLRTPSRLLLLESSPWTSFSSSSTLVSPTSHVSNTRVQCLDTCDESVESDASRRSRPSASLANRLPRMKVFMNKARKGSGCADAETKTPVISESTDEVTKPVRRSTIAFAAPWTISRGKTTTDTSPEIVSVKADSPSSRLPFIRRSSNKRPSTSPSPASVTPVSNQLPSSPNSISYFSRKSDRRRSTPQPRTQPYAYPYFAAMPIPPSNDDATLSSRTNAVAAEASLGSLTSPEDEEKIRGRDRRQVTQASLGKGRPTLPKRRSVSEGWAPRTRPPF